MSNIPSAPPARPAYPSDVPDDEWAFVVPYLTLLAEDAGQRRYPLREGCNGLRYVVRTGCHWRMVPHDLPPWPVVYQQARRWLAAGCFEALLHDVRLLLRLAKERGGQPTAAIFDSRTLQSPPQSGARAGYDGAKRRKGSKVQVAVDTLTLGALLGALLGDLLALVVTPADEQDRAQVAALAAAVQDVTGDTVAVAFVDQGYTGPATQDAATARGIQLVVCSWSSCRTPTAPSGASCCCPAAGSSSGTSPGPAASVAWPATTSAWPWCWRAGTSSPSPALCSTSRFP